MSKSDTLTLAPPGNHILDALPSRDYKRLLPYLEPVTLSFRTVLHEPDQIITSTVGLS
jgi:hypothetical protein